MRKHTLKVIATCLLIDACLIGFMSCNAPERREHRARKQATQVINHSDKDIIIETLHQGFLKRGVHKLIIDSSEYIIVLDSDGMAIAKHN
jgi:hypothetical protein